MILSEFEYEDEKWKMYYQEALEKLDEEFYPYMKKRIVRGTFTTILVPGLRKLFDEHSHRK